MKLKCLIIDDEPLAINVIKNHLEQLQDVQLIATSNNAVEGLSILQENDIDLIFLDINMPILDGLSFIKSLDKKPLIIITTAHTEFAVESYELSVLDYLVKPIPFPRFVKAINKAQKLVSQTKSTQVNISDRAYIFIKIDKKKMKKIYLDEILVIESLKDYLKITTLNERFIIHQTLSSFTDQLPSNNFIRIHRSYTVAIDKIESIEGNSVEIAGIRYMIGRTYNETVKSKLLNT